MNKFDTKVQVLKYEVLREVARHAWADDLLTSMMDIPKEITQSDHPEAEYYTLRELAILSERVKLAVGGDKGQPNIIQTIPSACDECPTDGYRVTDTCRGCFAHHCQAACPKDAITLDEDVHAYIDKSKCINCGKCAQVCPYSAIVNRKRPCQKACKVGAISMTEKGTVKIEHDKCISCGACVYQCPFGALSDKSFILKAIQLLKSDAPVYAIIAPSIASQFTYAKVNQVVTAIKDLGFDEVMEAALGADLVAMAEASELAEKGFLTSSCCPAFVRYIQQQFPTLAENISHNPSPMVATAKYIRDTYGEHIKTVFIGPCTAKKAEGQLPEVAPYVDCVLTFEELQTLLDSRNIDPSTLEETELNNASYYGRIFGHCGGLSTAAAEALKEQGIDFDAKPISCSGIEECRMALLKAKVGKLDANFIEGMACIGGCVNGAGSLTHSAKNLQLVEKHGKEAEHQTIQDSVSATSTSFKL